MRKPLPTDVDFNYETAGDDNEDKTQSRDKALRKNLTGMKKEIEMEQSAENEMKEWET